MTTTPNDSPVAAEPTEAARPSDGAMNCALAFADLWTRQSKHVTLEQLIQIVDRETGLPQLIAERDRLQRVANAAIAVCAKHDTPDGVIDAIIAGDTKRASALSLPEFEQFNSAWNELEAAVAALAASNPSPEPTPAGTVKP